INEEELVFAIGRLQEFAQCLESLRHLGVHAAARIKQQSNRDWRIIRGEVADRLLDIILEQAEVFAREAVNSRPAIGSRERRDHYQRSIYSKVSVRRGGKRSRAHGDSSVNARSLKSERVRRREGEQYNTTPDKGMHAGHYLLFAGRAGSPSSTIRTG